MSKSDGSGSTKPEKVRLLEELLSEPPTLEELSDLNDEALKALLAVAIRGYVRRLSEGEYLPPFPRDCQVSATDVVAAVSEMLEFVDVEIFELGMWKSWGRV